MPSTSEQDEAFAQAIEALSIAYPPTERAAVARSYRSHMVWAACGGKIDTARDLSEAAQLPKEHVTAIIALIYG